ncbi:MAG: hypothetical protein ACLR3C_19150 [Eggerthella lenta]
MSHERFDEDELRRAVIRIWTRPIPQVQVKLGGVYASLGSIQDRPRRRAGAPQRRQPVAAVCRTCARQVCPRGAAVRWWRLRPCSSC